MKQSINKNKLGVIITAIIWAVITILMFSSCSTERKCRNWQIKGQKIGCLKPDSIKVIDTIILTDYDTMVRFDTFNDVDTLIVENGGIKTLVFTKWKTREVRVQQKSDTIIKVRTIPVQKIVKGDSEKRYWWDKFWIGLIGGIIFSIFMVAFANRITYIK